MTNCDRISERMPDVADSRTPWSADEERHLAGCEACRLEWELIGAAARLGAAGPKFDEAAIADAVLRRLRAAPSLEVVPAGVRDRGAAAAGRRARFAAVTAGALTAALAAAASLVLLIRGGSAPAGEPTIARGESTVAVSPMETGRLTLPVPELEDVPAEALDTVLRSLERPFRAEELLESNWSDVESREFESGFRVIGTSEG